MYNSEMEKLYLYESNDKEIKLLSDVQKTITGDMKTYRQNQIKKLQDQLLNP
jgi:hypothetical protein